MAGSKIAPSAYWALLVILSAIMYNKYLYVFSRIQGGTDCASLNSGKYIELITRFYFPLILGDPVY